MGHLKIKDRRTGGTTAVPDAFIDYYMPRANGEFVKIYLFLLRTVSKDDIDPSLEDLADIFSCPEKDILRALRYWEKAGLLQLKFYGRERELESISLLPIATELHKTQSEPEEKPEPPEEIVPAEPKPEEKPAQISASRMKELKDDNTARQILFIAEQYIGTARLTKTDMQKILYFYDELHFPQDLIDYLIEYCVSTGHREISYITKVGLNWHQQGLLTVTDAKAHNKLWKDSYFSIFRAFGIRNRNPIPDEIRTMDRWLKEYGFSVELISEAARRTISKTGQPSFPYTERILSDWHKAGVHNLEAVAALDQAHRAEKDAAAQKAAAASSASRKPAASRFTNFEERTYDYSSLESRLLQNSKDSDLD
ncbi:MAG: DnaD domain protein [Eubacteriales bacterium]|nr:DnaD domain protein [Eubacteriales bacterium]